MNVSVVLALAVSLVFLNYVTASWSQRHLSMTSIRGGGGGDYFDNNNDDDPDDSKKLPLHGIQPDKFASVAPLIVAAVCSDGIVIIATHTSAAQEPLLLFHNDNNNHHQDGDDLPHMISTKTSIAVNSTESTTNTTADVNTTKTIMLPRDVSIHFRGPFRIQAIDGVGTTLVCSGWRTDGDWLTQKCRDLAQAELTRFGSPQYCPGLTYGRTLANEASLWMAQCAVSDQFRALSCVALIATSGDHPHPGYLWLIDATGAYRVRAHALGFGSAKLNQRLWGIDFSDYPKEQVAQLLLEMMVEKENNSSPEDDNAQPAQGIVDPKALVEVAVVDSSQQRMTRIRQPFLGSKHLPTFVPAKVSSN